VYSHELILFPFEHNFSLMHDVYVQQKAASLLFRHSPMESGPFRSFVLQGADSSASIPRWTLFILCFAKGAVRDRGCI